MSSSPNPTVLLPPSSPPQLPLILQNQNFHPLFEGGVITHGCGCPLYGGFGDPFLLSFFSYLLNAWWFVCLVFYSTSFFDRSSFWIVRDGVRLAHVCIGLAIAYTTYCIGELHLLLVMDRRPLLEWKLVGLYFIIPSFIL